MIKRTSFQSNTCHIDGEDSEATANTSSLGYPLLLIFLQERPEIIKQLNLVQCFTITDLSNPDYKDKNLVAIYPIEIPKDLTHKPILIDFEGSAKEYTSFPWRLSFQNKSERFICQYLKAIFGE